MSGGVGEPAAPGQGVALLPTWADEAHINVGRGVDGVLPDPRDPGRRVIARTRYVHTEEGREAHEILVEGGRLLSKRTGQPYVTERCYPAVRGWDDDRPDDHAMFVVDLDGRLYASDPTAESVGADAYKTLHRDPSAKVFLGDVVSFWHHSSVVAGRPVAFAGEVGTDRSGRVRSITNWSGHYRPGCEPTVDHLMALACAGVTLDRVVLRFVNAEGTTSWPAGAFLGCGGELDRWPEHVLRARALEGMRIAERVLHRLADEGTWSLYERAIDHALDQSSKETFDPDQQTHWNWLARWVLEENPDLLAQLRQRPTT